MRRGRWWMFVAALAAVAAVLFGAAACGDDDDGKATADPPPKTERDGYTKWYVQQALDRYQQTGGEATIDYYNNEAGSDDQWYLFVMEADSGLLAAHATIPSRIGTNSGQRVDITGYAYGPALKATDEEGQWVDYVFYNPQTDDGGTKHTWAVRRDNLIFASGWYEDSYPSPAPTKAEPGSFTQAFVEDAVWFYESNGRDALIEHFNNPDSTDPPSVDDQWYGFVTDLDGVMVSHPTFPENIGMTLHELVGTTPEGLVVADELMTATETGKWVDYTYTNPRAVIGRPSTPGSSSGTTFSSAPAGTKPARSVCSASAVRATPTTTLAAVCRRGQGALLAGDHWSGLVGGLR